MCTALRTSRAIRVPISSVARVRASGTSTARAPAAPAAWHVGRDVADHRALVRCHGEVGCGGENHAGRGLAAGAAVDGAVWAHLDHVERTEQRGDPGVHRLHAGPLLTSPRAIPD